MKFDGQIIHYKDLGMQFEIGPKSGSIDKPHVHDDEYQIEIFTSGTSKNLNVNSSELIVPGTINIFNPSDPHQVDYQHTSGIFYFLKKDRMRKLMDELGVHSSEPIFSSKQGHSLCLPWAVVSSEIQTLQEIKQALDQNTDDDALRMWNQDRTQSLLQMILKSLLPQVNKKKWDYQQSYQEQLIHRAIDWIETHYRNPNVSLAKIAQAAGLSEFHFARMFKKSTGKSPYQYLIAVRLRRSIELIKSKRRSTSLLEVALEVGFNSEKQLSYHFKNCLGYLPSAVG